MGSYIIGSSAVETETEGARVRAEAAGMIPDLIAGSDELLAKLIAAHEADTLSYKFRCERHGDFLAVFIQRGPQKGNLANFPYYYRSQWTRKVVSAINLINVSLISLVPGYLPDKNGYTAFSQTTRWNDAGKSEIGVIANQNTGSYPRYQMIEVSNLAADQQRYYPTVGHSEPDYLGNMNVPNMPRPAEDDRIHFLGAQLDLFTPAGIGADVYAQIMQACAASDSTRKDQS